MCCLPRQCSSLLLLPPRPVVSFRLNLIIILPSNLLRDRTCTSSRRAPRTCTRLQNNADPIPSGSSRVVALAVSASLTRYAERGANHNIDPRRR
ncbi:hypothetical protein B0H13DRAFT_2058680 [Mycena leptocephala]|nr:hypothetical protein B0H13DRAFT_2058680 [Mycena leptocephala]